MSMITTVNKNHHELAGTMVDVALAQGHPRLKVAQLLADHDAAKDARITELVAEIKDARNAWIGDDFGHLPLKEAIGAMRENFESRAEAAEALVTEKDKALSVIAIDFERGGSSPDDTRGNHISRRHLVMHSLALTPAVLTSELERLRTQVEVKDKCNDEIHQSFGKENDELRQQLAAANAEFVSAKAFGDEEEKRCKLFGEENDALKKQLKAANMLLDIRKGHLAEAARVHEAQKKEITELRCIFPQILARLKSGMCSSDCSLEFLSWIPGEVGGVTDKLRAKVAELESQRENWRMSSVCREHQEAKIDALVTAGQSAVRAAISFYGYEKDGDVFASEELLMSWRDEAQSFLKLDAAKQGMQAPSSATPGDDAIATGGSQ